MDKTEAQPAENVQVTVSATPQSTAYLLAVDQSVLLLKSGNDITAGQVGVVVVITEVVVVVVVVVVIEVVVVVQCISCWLSTSLGLKSGNNIAVRQVDVWVVELEGVEVV